MVGGAFGAGFGEVGRVYEDGGDACFVGTEDVGGGVGADVEGTFWGGVEETEHAPEDGGVGSTDFGTIPAQPGSSNALANPVNSRII